MTAVWPLPGSTPKPAPAVPPSSGGGSRPVAGSSSGRGAGLDSMIDLGGDLPAVDTAGFASLYQHDQVGLLRGVGWNQPALLVIVDSRSPGHSAASSGY